MVKSTQEIRAEILASQQTNHPDWLWVAGEPQVDVLDAVAEFHYQRELVVELLDSMKSLSGFKRLLDDTNYREEMASVLDLSTVKRNPAKVFEGVPREVANDMDAFIFFHLDRFGEKYGRKRRKGSAASGTITLNYTNGITSSVRIVLEFQTYLYVTTVTLDGSGTSSGIVFSFGYGTKYNIKANNLTIKTVTGGLTPSQVLAFEHTDIAGASDYQTNRSFLNEMDESVSIFSGPYSRNAVTTVIALETSVDKYKVQGAKDGYRFIGSTDVFIKGSIRQAWGASKLVALDMKILIPYQPSTIIGIYKAGALVPATEYTVTYPIATNEYIYSVQQQVWVDFTGSVVVFAGDTVDLQLEVDTSVQNVHSNLLAQYSIYMETARDVLTYQAQHQELDVEIELVLYKPYSQSVVNSAVQTALSTFISNQDIEDNEQPDDLRNEIRKIVYRGEFMVDAVSSLKIAKTGDALGIITLSLDRGQYWLLKNLTVIIL